MSSWLSNWASRKPSTSGSNGTPSSPSASSDSSSASSTTVIVIDIIKFGIYAGLIYYLTNKLLKQISSTLNELTDSDPKATKAAKKALAKRLGRPEIETMDFDSYELRIMPEVVGAEEIHTGFSDVGGLDTAIEEVKDNVVLPIQIWKYHKSYASISPCPTGVLLYGPPGTGKSLIAKAIAKGKNKPVHFAQNDMFKSEICHLEAGATFISIKASSILDKFMGESEKLASAIFKLGRKLSPSIIFIDEIETLLQKRRGDTHHAVSSLQGIFLAEWDGLAQQQKQEGVSVAQGPVVVLGATNRPQDLDPAFLRRMPVKLSISNPDLSARVAILQAQLRHEQVEEEVDIVYIAEKLEGCTGADIKEVIRIASLQRTKELTALAQKMLAEGVTNIVPMNAHNRPLNKADFEYALQKTSHSGSQAKAFTQEQSDVDMRDKFMNFLTR